ncbi:MAG: tetratricopeptide repeat protein [Lachnospiraceae bacterium]|nr:tetratricopeptide repeat protein [Lachnospiraceae bacterium]
MKKLPELIIGSAATAALLVITVIAIIIASVKGRSNDYIKHMELAQYCLYESRYEYAIAEYKAAIARMPRNAEAYLALAEVYIELENDEAAVEILGQGIKKTGAEELAVYLVRMQRDQAVQNENIPEESARETESENEDNQAEEENKGPREEIYYRDDRTYNIYEFDADGNRVKATYYLKDGTIVDYWEYEYDENGNLTKEAYYLEDGTIVDYWVYEYDDNGNKVKMVYYKADGTIDYYSIYEYDSNGNRVKVTGYNADGTIIGIDEFDADGNRVEATWY